MPKRLLFGLVILSIVLTSLLAACASSTSTSSSVSTAVSTTQTQATTQTSTPPKTTSASATVSNWWDKFGTPQYGGTLILRMDNLQLTFDPWTPWNHCWYLSDTLFAPDWKLDRKIWDFQTFFVPESYCIPDMVESWEWTDAQTCVMHIRQGIDWHNTSGKVREFTAEDIQYHYDRILGTGSGFSEPDGNLLQFAGAFERVTAQDKYTAIAKFKAPSAFINSQGLMEIFIQLFELPELVKSGGITEWQNATGTGAFTLTDYVPSTSAYFEKYPGYWGKDERYPQNKLPYVDQVKILCIQDSSTAIAALRTGKIDIMSNLDWQQADQLEKTHPDFQQFQVATSNICLMLRNDMAPFTDINVRRALSMAIDRPTIAATHYGGLVDPTPQGTVYAKYTGWSFPYEEWSQEDKDWHTYNPAAAKQLLSDAGYPDGFKTNIVMSSAGDSSLIQIIKAQFTDVGVDMEIVTMDFVAAMQTIQAGNFDQMAAGNPNNPHHPNVSFQAFYGGSQQLNSCHINDPTFNAMYDKFMTAPTVEESKQLSREMDKYFIEHYWRVELFPIAAFTITQPYFKGYSGESLHITDTYYWSRLWVSK